MIFQLTKHRKKSAEKVLINSLNRLFPRDFRGWGNTSNLSKKCPEPLFRHSRKVTRSQNISKISESGRKCYFKSVFENIDIANKPCYNLPQMESLLNRVIFIWLLDAGLSVIVLAIFGVLGYFQIRPVILLIINLLCLGITIYLLMKYHHDNLR